MKKVFISVLMALTLVAQLASAQVRKKVLFLGNSYTAFNNLPQLVADVSLSAGDTVDFSSNTPGGFTLQGHNADATSLSLLAAGDWDHVVLQEQSQRPSFPISQVQTSVFPYARALDSLAHAWNPCVQTVFYMTWGRKNGDASNCAVWPPVCTYAGMDSLLRLRYMQMAADNNAMASPVGAVWRHIRNTLPTIELYQSDESHPSMAGSYAAACTFYSVLFRKNPNLILFDAGLDPVMAAQIRQATKEVAFDSLSIWLVDAYDAHSDFSHSANGFIVDFNNLSTFSSNYNWDFGDGTNSAATNPSHNYTTAGSYVVSLTAENCFSIDNFSTTVNVTSTGLPEIHQGGVIYPNPALNELHWRFDGTPILRIDIFSTKGDCVKSIMHPSSPIHIEDLSAGSYAAKLVFENSVSTRPFIKLP